MGEPPLPVPPPLVTSDPPSAIAAGSSCSGCCLTFFLHNFFFFFLSLSPCFSRSLSQSVSVWVALHLSALTRLGIASSHHRKWWCRHFSPATTAAVRCWLLVSFPMPSHTRRNWNNPLSPSISVAHSRLSLCRSSDFSVSVFSNFLSSLSFCLCFAVSSPSFHVSFSFSFFVRSSDQEGKQKPTSLFSILTKSKSYPNFHKAPSYFHFI